MSGPLPAASRDRLYAALGQAISAAGEEREPLFFARLTLLLFEAVGDEERCRRALSDAQHELPTPSLSAKSSS